MITGLPDAGDWPGFMPKVDHYDAIRRDAENYAIKHSGDISSLLRDATLSISNLVPTPELELRMAMLEAGVRLRSSDRVEGFLGTRADGDHQLFIDEELTGDDLKRVLLHEVGHIRAQQLRGDTTEEAAEAWRAGWEQAL